MAEQRLAHLLCSIGVGSYQTVAYRLGDEAYRSPFAPVALARLLGLSGGKVSVLVTQGARDKWYDAMAAEFRQAGLEPEPVAMPEGSTEDEVLEACYRLVEVVKEGEQIILDVTLEQQSGIQGVVDLPVNANVSQQEELS